MLHTAPNKIGQWTCVRHDCKKTLLKELFSLWSKEKNKKYQNNTQVCNQEDGWQIIGVQSMRCSFWRNCKLPKNDGEHAHACSQSRSNINDMAEVHVSILWLQTQRSETQHSAEPFFYTCVSVLDENICLSFVDFFCFFSTPHIQVVLFPRLRLETSGVTLTPDLVDFNLESPAH
jgi:hypothetical protein